MVLTLQANIQFQEWVHSHQQLIEDYLHQVLPAVNIAPNKLHSAMRYSVLGGGKRVRALLVFAASELAQHADKDKICVAAGAVELVHAYSLVHDDLPCMDNDTLRRGKPTAHVEYDEVTALLVGDSLQSLAFQLLAEQPFTKNCERQLQMIKLLALSIGSRGMAGGQAIDLDSVGKSLNVTELEFMHIHKTGALIRAAAIMGANCGDGISDEELAHVDRFAKYTGLAYQVVDDVLDARANTATLGKTAGKDAQQNKPTYVSALGEVDAMRFAEELRQNALQALQIFDERATRLRQLVDFIITRKF